VLDEDLDGNARILRCDVDMGAYEFQPPCESDLDLDGDCDLPDLAQLLGNYGSSDASYAEGDVFGCDRAVGLADLAELLGVYGCGAGDGDSLEGGDQLDSAVVTITVVPYDTHGYTGSGFLGEGSHFIMDVKIELEDYEDDDWLVSGAALEASNDATFRLSTSATTPDAYATFVAAPWRRVPASATALLAGAYNPADPSAVFTTTALNLGWYDTDPDTADGPGAVAVMRIVIDVSEVEGADVSEGFGSVYFSTTGPAEEGDILLSDLDCATGTTLTLPLLKTCTGEFYVAGE